MTQIYSHSRFEQTYMRHRNQKSKKYQKSPNSNKCIFRSQAQEKEFLVALFDLLMLTIRMFD